MKKTLNLKKPTLDLKLSQAPQGGYNPNTLAYQGAAHPKMNYDGGVDMPIPEGIQTSTPQTNQSLA